MLTSSRLERASPDAARFMKLYSYGCIKACSHQVPRRVARTVRAWATTGTVARPKMSTKSEHSAIASCCTKMTCCHELAWRLGGHGTKRCRM